MERHSKARGVERVAMAMAAATLALIFFGALFLLHGCAGMSTKDTVDSIAEKAGFAAYSYLPKHKDIIVTTCTVKDIVQDSDDPIAIQGLISEQIGRIWVKATESDKVFVALLLNDMVRIMGLKTTNPTMTNVVEWLSVLDAFCGGVDLASKVKG